MQRVICISLSVKHQSIYVAYSLKWNEAILQKTQVKILPRNSLHAKEKMYLTIVNEVYLVLCA